MLQWLAGSDGMGEYTKPLGSKEPQEVCSRGWREFSGSGGVMGDRGRGRLSGAACVISAKYLERRFLNGALSSEISIRHKDKLVLGPIYEHCHMHLTQHDTVLFS